jgi:hypothetical protein
VNEPEGIGRLKPGRRTAAALARTPLDGTISVATRSCNGGVTSIQCFVTEARFNRLRFPARRDPIG